MNVLDRIWTTFPKYFTIPEQDILKVIIHAAGSWGCSKLPIAPYMLIQAPGHGHGKSSLLDIVAWLSPGGEEATIDVAPTEAVIFTAIELAKQDIPCLYLDEFGQLYNGKRDNSILTAIMDAGFQRGRKVRRVDTTSGRKLENFETFGPKCYTSSKDKGQGQFPESFLSRSQIINLRKRKDPRQDKDEARLVFLELGKELGVFIQSNLGTIDKIKQKEVKNLVPKQFDGREYDKWQNSFILTRLFDQAACNDVTDVTASRDAARWSLRCVNMALQELTDREEDPELEAVSLLRDMIELIVQDGTYDLVAKTKIPTEYFIPKENNNNNNNLLNIEESRWASYSYGKPLSQIEFAKVLTEVLKIKRPNKQGTIRISGKKDPVKGWDMKLMYEQIKEYCPDLYELHIGSL